MTRRILGEPAQRVSGRALGTGDRVAILCGNNRYFVVAYLATIGLGAIAVPLNSSSPAPELEHELAVVEAKAVVVGPSALPAWSQIHRDAVPSITCVVVAEGDQPMLPVSTRRPWATSNVYLFDRGGDGWTAPLPPLE